MTKRKPCRVEIKQVTHKDNVGYSQTGYIVSIDKPGSAVPYKLMDAAKPNKVKRYSTAWSAKRGALRNLKSQTSPVTGEWFYTEPSDKVVWIEFVFTTSKRRK